MNFFLMKWFIDEIKSGKPIMYYNIETTGEEMNQRILNTFFAKMKKSTLSDLVLKYSGYKNKLNKEI